MLLLFFISTSPKKQQQRRTPSFLQQKLLVKPPTNQRQPGLGREPRSEKHHLWRGEVLPLWPVARSPLPVRSPLRHPVCCCDVDCWWYWAPLYSARSSRSGVLFGSSTPLLLMRRGASKWRGTRVLLVIPLSFVCKGGTRVRGFGLGMGMRRRRGRLTPLPLLRSELHFGQVQVDLSRQLTDRVSELLLLSSQDPHLLLHLTHANLSLASVLRLLDQVVHVLAASHVLFPQLAHLTSALIECVYESITLLDERLIRSV